MSDKTKHAATLAVVLMGEARDGHHLNPAAPKQMVPHPESVAADALALIRIGKGVARWAVRACNGEGHRVWGFRTGEGHSSPPGWAWDDTDDAAKDKADERTRVRLQAIADRYGATVKLGGDPRGYVVKLILASGRHNTWGGASDGWGVA